MDDFAEKGTVGSGDGMAALALVRALVRKLEESRALSREDIGAIIDDALEQLSPRLVTEGGKEAKRLIEKLRR